jgi:TolA-binding protein
MSGLIALLCLIVAQSAGGSFEAAFRAETAGKLDEAIPLYREFIRSFPEDKNRSRAQYNIGECLFAQMKWEEAAAAFQKVVDDAPQDLQIAPRALFMKGMALKPVNREAADAVFREAMAKYPMTEAAEWAAGQLGGSVSSKN